jgi:glycosyltransferase involved in cell wall biosynthesis
MRVLMLSWEYPPHVVGGLGKHVKELVPALAALGAEVYVVTPRWLGGEDRERVNGATIYRVDPPPHSELTDFYTDTQRANWLMQEHCRAMVRDLGGFDIIHAHDWLVAFAAIAIKNEYKIPLLATIHATEHGRNRGNISSDISQSVHSAEWWLTYEAWRVICCSAFMTNEVATVFRSPVEKLDVIPNGVDTSRFDALAGVNLSDFRLRYAAPDERIVFHVGRIVHEKGMGVLVEAVPRVLASAPKTKFVIAGTGGYLDAARRRAQELGVGDNIAFAGFIPDADRDRLFRVADVAVFPSLYEPFGIVALEAMAAHTPVVVSNVGGLAEVVEHNETGLLVYPDNPDSLAWGIGETLRHPEWAAARAENAYRRVVSEYNWRSIAQRTLAVYERIARERAATAW